jgi:hypothetical protein
MDDTTKIIMGCLGTLLGWLHLRQIGLAKGLDQGLKEFVRKEDFEEYRKDLRQQTEVLIEIRVENAKWQTIVERLIELEQKKS